MSRRTRVLIEGWRGINHSYAMVNQYQLPEFAKMDAMDLFHLDVPFAKPTWSTTANNPGFPEAWAQVIAGISADTGGSYDSVLRIASPFNNSATQARRHVTYMTAEFGLSPVNFLDQNGDATRFIRGDDIVVVPSRWSRMKLIEYGFPAEKIALVSHGVSTELFNPITEAERTVLRQTVGIRPGDFVFLNLGAMTWNKGLDVLLRAFVDVRSRHPNAVLLLKDDPNLYGIGVSTVVGRMAAENGFTLSAEVQASIKLISVTLSISNLRLLYGAVDCYVSPYRAEGFNLPVIEAIACGTPVMVTRGGATDDFCDESTAVFIPSRQVENAARGIEAMGFHLEPELEGLVRQMDAMVRDGRAILPAFDQGRLRLTDRLSWRNCVDELSGLLLNG